MPRRRKEPHLFLRKARRDKQGRITHHATWIIKDGDVKVGTGCGEGEHEAAQLKLHEYNVQKYAAKALNLDAEDDDPPVPAKEYPIATAIMLYQHHKVPKMEVKLSTKGKQPSEGVDHKQVGDLKRRLHGLLYYWGDKTVAQINKDRCRKFDTVADAEGKLTKLSKSSKARYLQDLQSAVNTAMSEGKCETVALHWDIPKLVRRKRATWYTRDQIAALVSRSHRKKGRYVFSAKKSGPDKAGIVKETSLRPQRHVARMILVAVGTGTRSERVEMAAFEDLPGFPFIDVEAGIFWRSWEGEDVSSNKRADPCILHPSLLAHCRRWKRMGLRFLTEYRGRPVKVSGVFYRLVREVLGGEAPGRSIHTMRHTAATWLLSSPKNLNPSVIAGFLGMDVQILIDVYGHHSPNFQAEIREAWRSGDVGRNRSGKTSADNPVEKLLLEERRRGLFDLAEAFEAPSEVFAAIEAVTASGADALRVRIRQAGRTGDWSGFGEAEVIPIHRHRPPPFATGTTGIKGNEREPTRH